MTQAKLEKCSTDFLIRLYKSKIADDRMKSIVKNILLKRGHLI